MKCLNRNVLIGLGVVAVAVFLLAPAGRGALPLLLVGVPAVDDLDDARHVKDGFLQQSCCARPDRSAT